MISLSPRRTKIGLYDVAIIMCQQAVEKALKALYIAQTGKMPPRIHSIESIAIETRTETKLDGALYKLQEFYLQLRYPAPDGPLPYELATVEEAKQDIKLTWSALRLIDKEIKNVKG